MSDYTETTRPVEPTLYAGNFRALQIATLLSGEGAVGRGTVLALDRATGKYVVLVKEVVVAAEDLVVDAGGSLTDFDTFVANPPIIPGTLTVDATVSAGAVEATDPDSNGKVTGDSGNISGFAGYEAGYVRLNYTTAPDDDTDITADYTHGDEDNQHVAVAILNEDADSTAADADIVIALVGEYRASDLTWPTGITDANKARALDQLRERGIIVK